MPENEYEPQTRDDRIRTECLYASLQLDAHRPEPETAARIVSDAKLFEEYINPSENKMPGESSLQNRTLA